jgi:signal peptidase I
MSMLPVPDTASDSSTALPQGRSTARQWAAFLPRLLARTALFALGSLLFFAVVPALIGWHVTTVMSDSMAPRFVQGDLIVSMPMPGNRVVPGQVALFHDPDHPERLRLHRVVKVSPTHVLTTKGDANPQPDSTPVQPSAVLGVGVMRIPYVGEPIFWIRTGEPVPLGIFGAALAGALVLAMPSASASASTGSGRPRAARRRHRTPGQRGQHLTRGVTLALVVTAAGGTLAIAVATPAHSSFSSSSTTPVSTLAAASAFPCLTAIPQTPAPASFYYRFGETAGTTAADVSGNGHTATLHGGVTHTAGSCAAGNAPAVTLDGSTGYISTPSEELAPNTFTLSLWFKTTTTAGGKLIGFGSSATGASSLYDRQLYLSNGGQLNFGVFPGLFSYSVITSPKAYNDGAWHQVIATLSGSGMHLYVDGGQVAQNTSVTSGEFNVGYWRIGYDSLSSSWPNAPTSPYYRGSLSDVSVYTAALSASQAAASFAVNR